MNLLIVDDYPTNRKLLRVQLEAAGHVVVEASNGVEALERIEHESVDAVISDILMPSMDGFRLCNEIRKSERFGALLLILYTANYNSPSDRQLAESVGADGYILKPAPISVLLGALREAASGSLRRARRKPQGSDETYVLKQYNEALVRKLEQKNALLQRSCDELRAVHQIILELNLDLEACVFKRAEALRAASDDLEAFSHSVSHDLRVPLLHIGGFIQVLEAMQTEPPAHVKEVLDRIRSAVTRMHRLIDDLIAFSRLGQSGLSVVAVDLSALVDEVIEALQADCTGRNITWHRSALPLLNVDKALLYQVFINLIGNAIKYTTPISEVQIDIGSKATTEGHTIFVKDNGIGFDMKFASNLFGVFQRLHTSDEFEGTGIGLASVKRIVSRHGGHVWAESALSLGSTFFFSLPRTVEAFRLGT